MLTLLRNLWPLVSIVLSFSVLTLAQPPSRSLDQAVIIVGEDDHNKSRNGSAVPGDSPVKYYNDPGNDLFRIESLDMHPNPCVL